MKKIKLWWKALMNRNKYYLIPYSVYEDRTPTKRKTEKPVFRFIANKVELSVGRTYPQREHVRQQLLEKEKTTNAKVGKIEVGIPRKLSYREAIAWTYVG